MIGTLVGTGEQAVLNLHPQLYWDARMAQQASGAYKNGGMAPTMQVYETTAQVSSAKWLTMRNDKRAGFMRNGIDTTAGKNECLGSVGAFYSSTTNYFTAYTTAKYGFAVVTPTDPSQLTEDAADFPDIVRDGDIATSRYRIYLDTSLDAVNDLVIEKAQVRSTSYVRTFQVLVRNTDGFTTPDGVVTLGWNDTAATRTTVATQFRSLGFNGWYSASILVASGTATGYLSIKATADTDIWEIALPLWFTSTSSIERVTRLGLSAVTGARYKYAVRTGYYDITLRTSGWLAMSIVLPDRSVSNGHTNNLGAADYKFLGMLNLDCGTWRLRASMSDTYDQVVINLGDTSGTNFAFLNGLADWNDFEALGIVATWFKSNGSTYAVLYVNGQELDSIEDPATWYPEACSAGIMYIGISDSDGTVADTFISRVAYGSDRMHRSTARVLSLHMKNLARGANPI
jgi:hypothetical protein